MAQIYPRNVQTLNGSVHFYADDCGAQVESKYGSHSYCEVRDGCVVDAPPKIQFFNRAALESALARGETSGRNSWRWEWMPALVTPTESA